MQNSAKILNSTLIPVLGGKYLARAFSFAGLADQKEHIALVFNSFGPAQTKPPLPESTSPNLGEPEAKDPCEESIFPPGFVPLVRIHSECLTGDVFGSAKCDCGPQLNESLERCATEGGVILYLRQEGRGIGLYNKISAYALQEKGLDTFEANHALQLPDDLRSYHAAAEMLHALGILKVRLLSNNPQKPQELIRYGIEVVKLEPTGIFANSYNYRYLKSKVLKSGHKISQEDLENIAKKTFESGSALLKK